MPETRPPPPVPAATGRVRDAGMALALLVAVALAYLPVWRAGFVWDDDGHVTPAALQPLSGLRRIWLEANATQQYYPVLHTAFWGEHRLWGDAPLGYHLLNLALHAAAAFLFYRVLRRLAVPGAGWAAGLFALHPVAVESVAWISEQKNTLSAVFYFGAALAYLRFDRGRRPPAYAAATLLFLGALGAKTVTATLPAALLVVFWWERGRIDLRRDVVPLLPWFAAAAAAAAVTSWMERTFVGARGPAFALSLGQRLLLAGRVVWFYLGKLCWPHPLIFVYPRWQISAADPVAYAYPLALLGLLAGLWAWRRRARAPLAAALLFIGTLFPALGFVNVFPFIYSYVADHFQYLAAAVFMAALAAGAAVCTRRWEALPRGAAAAAVLLGLGILTFRQAQGYTDEETLWRTTLARNPAAAMAAQNLGGVYMRAGQAERAVPLFQTAVGLHPEDPEAHNELAVAWLQVGQPERAAVELEQVLAAHPDSVETHLNLGVTLLQLGRPAEAASHFARARELDPQNVKALKNLALSDERAGRWAEAAELWRQASGLEPDNADTELALAGALASLGRAAEAVPHYRHVLARRPVDPAAELGLGEALVQLKDLDGAEGALRAVLTQQAANPEALVNLTAVLGYRQRWGEVVVYGRRAAAADPRNPGVWSELAVGYLQTRDAAAAVAAARAALELRPRDAGLHNLLGIALAQLGRADEAAAEFGRALALDPGLSAARRNLAHALGPP